MVWAVPLRLSAGPQAVRTAAQTGQHLSHNRDKETLASINMLHKINGLSRCAGEGFGIISGPNLYLASYPPGRGKRGAQRFGGSITDVETRLEKTQDHRDGGEQGLPSALRGLPAIGIDRLRRISGLQGLRFAGKHAIRFFQVYLGG